MQKYLHLIKTLNKFLMRIKNGLKGDLIQSRKILLY